MAEGRACTCDEDRPAHHAKPKASHRVLFAMRQSAGGTGANDPKDQGREAAAPDRGSGTGSAVDVVSPWTSTIHDLAEFDRMYAGPPKPTSPVGDSAFSPTVREMAHRRWTCVPGTWKAASFMAVGLLLCGTGVASVRAWTSDDTAEARYEESVNRTPELPPVFSPPDPIELKPNSASRTGAQPAHESRPAKPRPHPSKNRPKPPAPRPEDNVVYAAWAGPGCADSDGVGYYERGRYSDDHRGWYTASRGGFRGGTCDGSFTAVPMSGSSTYDHSGRVFWWWHVGGRAKDCSVSVYIPSSHDGGDVAGSPTHYVVLNGDPAKDDGFEVDQVANRGRVVHVGTWPVRHGRMAVVLLDRGRDWTGGRSTYAHHAAGPIQVVCHS
ncbi:hypothetical protein [Wenjunlia tyrosinilytica]|nr:hypothetical protein [Wenjunlia tyrosinilytica]